MALTPGGNQTAKGVSGRMSQGQDGLRMSHFSGVLNPVVTRARETLPVGHANALLEGVVESAVLGRVAARHPSDGADRMHDAVGEDVPRPCEALGDSPLSAAKVGRRGIQPYPPPITGAGHWVHEVSLEASSSECQKTSGPSTTVSEET